MLKKLVSFIAKKIKGRELKLDPSVSDLYLLRLVFTQAFCLIRGLFTFGKLVALGGKCSIFSRGSIFLSRGVSIGRLCHIDGLGKQGLVIGEGSSIGACSFIKVSGTLTDIGKGIVIGDNVGIGEFSHIGGAGGVRIGSNTISGAYLSIHPENHVFEDPSVPIRLQGVTRKGIDIGENCWIGSKVTILDGAVVGDGCVIAAGAVVRGRFPPNCIIGGVPAKIIRKTNGET